MVGNYIISEVKDHDTNERSKEFGYRVGRECVLDLDYITVGMPLIVHYPNNSHFVGTVIEQILKFGDYDKLVVATQNRTYEFTKIDNKS